MQSKSLKAERQKHRKKSFKNFQKILLTLKKTINKSV